jgi:hypothetical protein
LSPISAAAIKTKLVVAASDNSTALPEPSNEEKAGAILGKLSIPTP